MGYTAKLVIICSPLILVNCSTVKVKPAKLPDVATTAPTQSAAPLSHKEPAAVTPKASTTEPIEQPSKPLLKPTPPSVSVDSSPKKPVEKTVQKPKPENTTTKKVVAKLPKTIIEQPKPVPAVIPKITVELESLPIAIGSWTLDKPALLDQEFCTLKSETVIIKDGAGGTPIYILVQPTSILIPTKSNIDLSYPNSQLMVANKAAFQFDGVEKETIAVVNKQYNSVINSLKKAKIATAELGFWPSWPKTQSYRADINVVGFNQAYSAWQDCNRLL